MKYLSHNNRQPFFHIVLTLIHENALEMLWSWRTRESGRFHCVTFTCKKSFHIEWDGFNPCVWSFMDGVLFLHVFLHTTELRCIQSHCVCAIIALRQTQIMTGDIAQSNMMLFIRMDVWQQIILAPLFPSFMVMTEVTNPYSGISENALYFLHSGFARVKKAIYSEFGRILQWHLSEDVVRGHLCL